MFFSQDGDADKVDCLMNNGLFFSKNLVALFLLISLAMMLGACSEPDETSAVTVVSGAIDARPINIAKAYIYGGGKCYIDSSTPPTVSNLIVTSRKLPFSITGWAMPDEAGRKHPPFIFAVLNGANGAYYLEGKRVPRPDVALAMARHPSDQAGYEIAGSLLNIPAGEYQLGVATGSEIVVAVCKTQVVVRIND